VQTIYLAFATLGFNTALWLVMRNEEWLTGGTFGINNIARPSICRLEPGRQPGLLLLRAGVAVVMALLLWGLLRRPGARPSPRCATTRSAPRAWASTSAGYTLLSFAIGAVYAGVAGAPVRLAGAVHRARSLHRRAHRS
jgi:branched-chain amino acid transport system permease protein